jgi:hypothetical protein
MARANAAPVSSRPDAIEVTVGQVYTGQGGRRIQIEAVYIDDAVPRVSAVELVSYTEQCGRAVLHAHRLCGCTSEVRSHGDPFTIVCTYRDAAWRLPAWYEEA